MHLISGLQFNFYAFEQNFREQRRWQNKNNNVSSARFYGMKKDEDMSIWSNSKATQNDFLHQHTISFIFSCFVSNTDVSKW